MTILNLNQQSDELNEIHGEKDYYWYLRSPEFIEAFIKPLGGIVDSFGEPCLDVACGEGVLYDHVNVPYVGIEGSEAAIAKARRDRPKATVMLGRMESPAVEPQPGKDRAEFGTIIFGGLLAVLVKPEHHVEFVNLYRQFNPRRFIIYDLERTDTSFLDKAFRRTHEFHGVANLKKIIDVKRRRKILVYGI